MRSLPLAVALSLVSVVPAQIGAGHAIVLTDDPTGPVRTVLLDVDPATGGVVVLPRFATDFLRSYAIAVDPIDGDLVVAQAAATGGTVLNRLRLTRGQFGFPRGQGTLPDVVTDLAFGGGGELFATWRSPGGTGGILRFERLVGTSSAVQTFGLVTAMELPSLSTYAMVADLSPNGPRLTQVDLATGQIGFGPQTIPGLGNAAVTGISDLPTGAIRQALTDDQGRVHLFEFLSSLRTIPLSPPLPVGGAVAMRGQGLDAIVLGGASHPLLIRVPVFGAGAGAWATLAGPFPGDPVDFALAELGGPRVLPFGSSCAGAGVSTWTSQPSVGNPQFGLGVRRASPGAAALLVLGLTDHALGPQPLPVALPGGCLLRVSTEAPLATTIDPLGNAGFATPIPNQPALIGARFFAQWLTLGGGALGSSDGVAVWIG